MADITKGSFGEKQPICPHCQHPHDIDGDFFEDWCVDWSRSYDIKCRNCGKTFYVSVNASFTYDSEALIEYCPVCESDNIENFTDGTDDSICLECKFKWR